MVNKKENLLKNCTILGLILIAGLLGSFYFSNIENFQDNKIKRNVSWQNMHPVNEKIDNDLLLKNWYSPHQPNPRFSNMNQEEQFRNAPIFPANVLWSNNILKWRLPENGECQPPGICGEFYERLEQEYTPPPKPPPMYDESNPRINFYTSCPNRNN